MPKEMKASGIEWIGDIPRSWKIIKVKDGFVQKKAKAYQNDPVILTLARDGVKIRDISTNEGQIASSYFEYNPVEPLDMLLNPMDLQSGANCSLSKVSGVISPAYINLRYKPGYDPSFYDYYFKYQYWSFAFFAHGKGVSFENRWTLNNETLMNYPLIAPSYEEQQCIADYLDSKCTEIDALSADIQKQIEKLEEYKRSVITEAVTKGLDPNAEMKDSGIKWIGEIPEKWSINRVANLFAERNEPGDEKLPFLSVSINSGISDKELSEEEMTRQFVRADAAKNKRVYPGDIVYNMMRAWQGAIGAVRTDGMVSAAYVTARPLSNIDTRYYEYLLRTPTAIQEMNKYSYGIMDFRKRLYWSYFRIITLCVPPLEEQKAIADYADFISQEIKELINLKKQQLSTLEEYKKSVIYEYVTGKKEVPDATI